MAKFIMVGEGYQINIEQIAAIYEPPNTMYASLYITLNSGKEIIIEHKYKAVAKEKLKELFK